METFTVSIIKEIGNLPAVVYILLVSDIKEGSECKLGEKISELLNSAKHFAIDMNGFRFQGNSIFSLVKRLEEIESREGSLTLIGLSKEDAKRLRNAQLSKMFKQCSTLREYTDQQHKAQ